MKPPRRRLPPKPPEPPPGHMWGYWDIVPIADVEAHAKQAMRGFDRLPRWQRDLENGNEYVADEDEDEDT
jgi:hypothetical protein